MINLEQRLRETAEAWLDEECLSPQQAAELEEVIRRAGRRRRFARVGSTAAAAMILIAAVNWPVVVSFASEAPLVGPFINRMANRDRGALWAEEKGLVVPVNASATSKGYTFQVESVAADASRTIVYFTIDGPDLTMSSAPMEIRATYNRSPATRDGYGSMRWEIVEGRMVGQVNLPPLPHPTALVGIKALGINGLQGDWNVSFMASRAELDRLTRTIEVDKHLEGDGYDLVLHRITLAPTETWVEMSGMVASYFELRRIELLADGVPVRSHGGSWGGQSRNTNAQVHPMKFMLPFERVDGEPKSLTLRLVGVKRWLDGGPVIDLTNPGSQAVYEGNTFTLDSVSVSEGFTKISLQIPGDDSARDRAWGDFADWVLVDAAGEEHKIKKGSSATASTPMEFSFEGVATSPVRLEARRHTAPASGSKEIAIPLEPVP